MGFLIGDSNLVCMDWDERSLRIVNASLSRSSVQIRQAVHVPFDAGMNPRDPAAVGEFIRRVLGEHRIRSRRVVVDIPRQDAVLNLLSLPKGSLSELAAMVHMQIGKELPFSKDQAVIDFAIARQDEGSGTCDIWVAAVRNNIIDHVQQVMLAAGLKLERIGLRPYANVEAATAGGIQPGRTLMIDVGPSMTEINVIRDGRLAYSRAASVSIPAAGMSEAPASAPPRAAPDSAIPLMDSVISRPSPMDALLVDVSRTIEAYRATDPGARIDRILLAGTGGIDEKLAQAFANRFGAPTSLFQVPPSLKWRAADEESAVPYSAAMGLALTTISDSSVCFNFAKPKQAEDERRERVRRVPQVAALVAVLVVAAGVAAYMPLRKWDKRIAEVNAQINVAERDKKARQELAKQLTDIESWMRKNVVWVDVLKRFTDEVMTSNKDAYLNQLDMNETGRIVMKMVAVDAKVAPKLAEAAESMKDSTGRPVLGATVGNWHPRIAGSAWRADEYDKRYDIEDEVVLQVQSQVAAAKTRPAAK